MLNAGDQRTVLRGRGPGNIGFAQAEDESVQADDDTPQMGNFFFLFQVDQELEQDQADRYTGQDDLKIKV